MSIKMASLEHYKNKPQSQTASKLKRSSQWNDSFKIDTSSSGGDSGMAAELCMLFCLIEKGMALVSVAFNSLE